MKKVMMIIMPLTILIAFFGYYLSRDINFRTLLLGMKDVNFVELDLKAIQYAFEQLDMRDVWTGINNPLDFLQAIGESISSLVGAVFGLIRFSYESLKWFVMNLIAILRFVFTYLFGK